MSRYSVSICSGGLTRSAFALTPITIFSSQGPSTERTTEKRQAKDRRPVHLNHNPQNRPECPSPSRLPKVPLSFQQNLGKMRQAPGIASRLSLPSHASNLAWGSGKIGDHRQTFPDWIRYSSPVHFAATIHSISSLDFTTRRRSRKSETAPSNPDTSLFSMRVVSGHQHMQMHALAKTNPCWNSAE